MRLMIRLRCTEDGPYEMQYHYHLQGFIYKLLEGSKYHYVHDKEGYKFFCFSNIFPAYDLKVGDIRTLIISSPDREFIEYLKGVLSKPWNIDVKVGSMKFKIDSNEKLSPIISDGTVDLITGTPIIVRILKEKYQVYDIHLDKEYDYVFWRKEHPLELFVSQLKSNLLKKYADYQQASSYKDNEPNGQDISLFQRFKFKKQISTKVVMKGTEQTIIGTIWEFGFHPSGEMERKPVQFALDAGLGERNSLGFGFTNIK